MRVLTRLAQRRMNHLSSVRCVYNKIDVNIIRHNIKYTLSVPVLKYSNVGNLFSTTFNLSHFFHYVTLSSLTYTLVDTMETCSECPSSQVPQMSVLSRYFRIQYLNLFPPRYRYPHQTWHKHIRHNRKILCESPTLSAIIVSAANLFPKIEYLCLTCYQGIFAPFAIVTRITAPTYYYNFIYINFICPSLSSII